MRRYNAPMLLTSFSPEVGLEPQILLLGSMPGAESLRRRQYYAHPRNLFWPIMGELVGAGLRMPYSERIAVLKDAGIALWDSLKHCERVGSLDGSIVNGTEVPNAVARLLHDQPTIRFVGFNGQKSAASFQRHILPALDPECNQRLELMTLPSTSPANASKTWDQKLNLWRSALAPYLLTRSV